MGCREKYGVCPLCKREIKLTFHHLIPKTLHSKKWYKKNFTKDQLNDGMNICRMCHSGIHDLYDEKTLGKEFNTSEKIINDPAIMKHSKWVSKQK
jgi:hypothetical protein